jgi:hypothetical protein
MELTKDALQLLIQTGQEARSARIFKDLATSREQTVYVGDELLAVAIPPADRGHAVFLLDDLIAYAQRLLGRPTKQHKALPAPKGEAPPAATVTAPANPVIWYSAAGVVLIIDDADRRDRVIFRLSFSPQFALLQTFEHEMRPMDQRTFIRTLRFALGLAQPLVNPFRRLDWSQTVQAVGEILATRDRLGRQVEAAVTGAIDLPEEMTVPVPVYEQAGQRGVWPIQCVVETDCAAQRLALIPLPGEIEATIDRTQAEIGKQLEAALGGACPIYYGQP